MKINGKDYDATPWRYDPDFPQVRLRVSAYGFQLAEEYATPDQARELAAQLQLAADVAEGKSA